LAFEMARHEPLHPAVVDGAVQVVFEAARLVGQAQVDTKGLSLFPFRGKDAVAAAVGQAAELDRVDRVGQQGSPPQRQAGRSTWRRWICQWSSDQPSSPARAT